MEVSGLCVRRVTSLWMLYFFLLMMDREVSYESENGKVIENVMNGVKILKGNVGCDFFFGILIFVLRK